MTLVVRNLRIDLVDGSQRMDLGDGLDIQDFGHIVPLGDIRDGRRMELGDGRIAMELVDGRIEIELVCTVAGNSHHMDCNKVAGPEPSYCNCCNSADPLQIRPQRKRQTDVEVFACRIDLGLSNKVLAAAVGKHRVHCIRQLQLVLGCSCSLHIQKKYPQGFDS
jgi:hypothetical protein